MLIDYIGFFIREVMRSHGTDCNRHIEFWKGRSKFSNPANFALFHKSKTLQLMSQSPSRFQGQRKLIVLGAVAAVLVVSLIVGMMFIQTGSNVSEVTTNNSSSTAATTSPSSSSQSPSSSSSSSTVVSTIQTTTSTYTGPTGILGVSLTDPPIVPPGVTDVYITYSSVQVHVSNAGNEDGWYVVADSGSVDLMSLVNVSLTLGSAEVQTGDFNLISFNITSAAVTLDGVNQTAYVPANRINVPIIGGISVSQGNSSGVLVDLSPQVIPYENGTSISYALVPEARSLPIPRSVWNYTLEVKGAKLTQIQNQTWATQSAGQVVVTGVSVTPNSFSLTLQNQGTSNATFSSIVIGQVLPFPECSANATSSPPSSQGPPPPNQGSPRPASDGSGANVSITLQNESFSGPSTVYISGTVYPPPSLGNASASISVANPNGAIVDAFGAPVNLNGSYYASFNTGDSSLWVHGLYSIIVSYNGTSGMIHFNWTPAVQTTTSTTTTTSEDYSNSTSTAATTNTTSTSESSTSMTNETSSTSYSNTTSSTTTARIMEVSTNGTSFFGHENVLIYGGVTPAPNVSSSSVEGNLVYVRVLSPAGEVVFSTAVPLLLNGTFNVTFTTGSPFTNGGNGEIWVNGTYKVYAYQKDLVGYSTFLWQGASSILNYTNTTMTQTTTTNSSWTRYENSTQYIGQQVRSYLCGLYVSQDRDGLPLGFPVSYFAILSNGTLYPVNYTSLVMNSLRSVIHMEQNNKNNSGTMPPNTAASISSRNLLAYTLAPGQSVTFTYNGPIDSLSGSLLSYIPRSFAVPSSLFQINPGQQYTVVAAGPFDTRVATLVNATSS